MTTVPQLASRDADIDPRHILDYVGAMSRELSELAERAGYDDLAGELRSCGEKAREEAGQ